jgi:hypothetical protein
MTVLGLLRGAIDHGNLRVQFLHECVMAAKAVKRTKANLAHTRVEFATENMTPNDLMYFSSGRPDSRKPQYMGVVVWIPTDVYMDLEAQPDTENS